jgi:hypothetical protein
MESLIGKKAKGFKFSGSPTYVHSRMNQYNGVVGKITYTNSDVVQIKFPDDQSWNYPYEEALTHLVEEELEEEQSIEQILNNIKNLTKQI